MSDIQDLLKLAYERSAHYQASIPEKRVFPAQADIDRLAKFDEPLPDAPQSAEETLKLLDEIGSPATVASTGGRYFGFVTGGTLPVTLATNWLTGAWDQNAADMVGSPVSVKIEHVALKWLCELLGLPPNCGGGFVTGATMANFTGLCAARQVILQKQGWDVNAQGLFAAPPITLVVGDEVHVSLLKALMLLGLGRERVIRVPVDNQGRMRADQLPPLDDKTIVCIQAGNVNTGAFDPAWQIIEAAHAVGAWVHVDAAFGLWALATPEYAHLADGVALADSWATDAHKWLNVPYDSGIAFVRDPRHLQSALMATASYLINHDDSEAYHHFVPEFSRRARGIEIWAALRTLGKQGLANMVACNCHQAMMMANLLHQAGFTIHNDVVLNQVLVSFGEPELTRRTIAAIQAEGTTWAGGTVWQGNTAMRISVSSWATTDDDIQRCAEAIIRIAQEVRAHA